MRFAEVSEKTLNTEHVSAWSQSYLEEESIGERVRVRQRAESKGPRTTCSISRVLKYNLLT